METLDVVLGVVWRVAAILICIDATIIALAVTLGLIGKILTGGKKRR